MCKGLVLGKAITEEAELEQIMVLHFLGKNIS